MEVGSEFVLMRAKPKSTLFQVYTVFRKVEELNCDTEYWYYNDNGKLSTVELKDTEKVKI